MQRQLRYNGKIVFSEAFCMNLQGVHAIYVGPAAQTQSSLTCVSESG
jgi:hypothetical protein